MKKIRITKNSKWGNKNKILYVSNNVAHSILDAGVGKIIKDEPKKPKKNKYQHRMMEAEK